MTSPIYVSRTSLDRERAVAHCVRAADCILRGGIEGHAAALLWLTLALLTVASLDTPEQDARQLAVRTVREIGEER